MAIITKTIIIHPLDNPPPSHFILPTSRESLKPFQVAILIARLKEIRDEDKTCGLRTEKKSDLTWRERRSSPVKSQTTLSDLCKEALAWGIDRLYFQITALRKFMVTSAWNGHVATPKRRNSAMTHGAGGILKYVFDKHMKRTTPPSFKQSPPTQASSQVFAHLAAIDGKCGRVDRPEPA